MNSESRNTATTSDSGVSPVNVPVEIRTHEVDQLHEMCLSISERLRAIEHTDAEDYAQMYEEYVEGLEKNYPEGDQFAAYLSMPADEWRLLVRHLDRYDDLRAESLQSKLMRRLDDKLEEFME